MLHGNVQSTWNITWKTRKTPCEQCSDLRKPHKPINNLLHRSHAKTRKGCQHLYNFDKTTCMRRVTRCSQPLQAFHTQTAYIINNTMIYLMRISVKNTHHVNIALNTCKHVQPQTATRRWSTVHNL